MVAALPFPARLLAQAPRQLGDLPAKRGVLGGGVCGSLFRAAPRGRAGDFALYGGAPLGALLVGHDLPGQDERDNVLRNTFLKVAAQLFGHDRFSMPGQLSQVALCEPKQAQPLLPRMILRHRLRDYGGAFLHVQYFLRLLTRLYCQS